LAAVRHLGFGNSNFLTVAAVKRPILHQRTKFSKNWFSSCGDITIFCDFQDGGRRHVGFCKIRNFNGLSPLWGQSTSPCKISSKSVKLLLRYDDLTVFFQNGSRHPYSILEIQIF